MALQTFIAASSPSIAETLGLNLTSLILYGLAFLVTVAILGKYVWPPLTKALDVKRGELEAATRLEQEAKDVLQHAEQEAKKALLAARKTAEEAIATAKSEAAAMISAAEDKARVQADQIVADANATLEQQLRKARETLARETAELVARATSVVLDEKIDAKTDGALIERGIKQAGGKA